MKRGIFHGESQSPLLLIISLIPLTLIPRKCKEAYQENVKKLKTSAVANNGLTTYFIWTNRNYMAKQTKVLIH